jgi:putative transposase
MPNTYTHLYLHCVFAVKYRAAMLHPQWDDRLRSYIIAIAQNNKHKVLAINNMPDHMHLFVGWHPDQSLADMMRLVKGKSAEWINKERLTKQPFHWQEGYGAFSHSRSQIDAVVKYIHRQQEHHRKVTFIEEYQKMLDSFGVEYDERHIFHEPVE